MLSFIDTHCHLDGEEFAADLDEVVARAREAGVTKVLVPGIDLKSCQTVLDLCSQYPGYCYPMLGLHPEEVRSDWPEILAQLKSSIFHHPSPIIHHPSSIIHHPSSITHHPSSITHHPSSITHHPSPIIAIGEVGLDFYWSREFEQEQLEAFEEQVRWSVETRLPLMIHCRKAQNEMVTILKRYANDLPGGVFHCFTGNEIEARELLQFDRFLLGIGGVLTFKKSNLPVTLPAAVPLDRIVLETDAPYMAPVPHRGQRNEPAFVLEVLRKMAECYGVSEETVCAITNTNVTRIFGLK